MKTSWSPLIKKLFFQCDQDRSIFWVFYLILIYIFGLRNYLFLGTRSYAALRAADLDWIVRPGYSSGGDILRWSQHLALCLRHSARICFVICHPSSVICHPSSVIHCPSFDICHLSSPSVVHNLSSVIRLLSSVVRRPSSVSHLLSSVICHSSSVVRRLPSVTDEGIQLKWSFFTNGGSNWPFAF